MAHRYAQQLMAEGDVRKAVSYTLISDQKNQAIEMFSSQQLYRESVALTRCVYPEESAQVQESLSLWATKAVSDGNLELAVKCFVANGEVAEAARTLARRSDPSSLKLSADLAASAGLSQLAAAYLQQATDVELSPPTNGDPITDQVASIDQAAETVASPTDKVNCDTVPNGATD